MLLSAVRIAVVRARTYSRMCALVPRRFPSVDTAATAVITDAIAAVIAAALAAPVAAAAPLHMLTACVCVCRPDPQQRPRQQILRACGVVFCGGFRVHPWGAEGVPAIRL